MPQFSLTATGSTPWFLVQGAGNLYVGAGGTWTGTQVYETRDAEGNARTLNYWGQICSFTTNYGVMRFEGHPFAVRVTFTRTTGTLNPYCYSADSQIYFPDYGKTFASLPTSAGASGTLWRDAITGVVTLVP